MPKLTTIPRTTRLDVRGAAALIGCEEGLVYKLVDREEITFYRVGGRILFDPADVRGYVEAARKPARVRPAKAA